MNFKMLFFLLNGDAIILRTDFLKDGGRLFTSQKKLHNLGLMLLEFELVLRKL